MSIQTLENRKLELQQELAAKQRQDALERDLADVEAKLQQETKKRYSLRQDWLNRMSKQQQDRLQAEQDEREILAEINEVLPGMAARLLDARTRKTEAVVNLLGTFEGEHNRHNFDRVGTAEHFHNTMREMGVNVRQFPKWAIRKRLFGDFFQSEYQTPNTGSLSLAIDSAVEAVKK